MSYMGIDWKLENNNPTIRCPYRRLNCEQNHPLLRSVMVPFMEDAIIIFCACHEVPAPYDYEKSADKVFDDYERKKEALFQEFAKGKRVCKWQCSFDEHTETWEQGYEPFICVNRPVPCEYCSILDKELDKRKGNIFYDIKTTRKPEELSLFSQEFEVSIQKDKRLLQNNVSLDICKEGILQGGAGEQFSYLLYQTGYSGRYVLRGVDAKFVRQATMQQSLGELGLDAEGIYQTIVTECGLW